MSHMGLFESIQPLIVHVPVTGNGALTSPIIDMQGWNGLAVMAVNGASTGGTTTPMVLRQSSDSGMAGSTVVASGTVTPGTAANTFGAFEAWRPTGRYVQITSTPAGTVAFAAVGFQYSHTGTLPSGTATVPTGGGTASIYTKLQVN